MNDTLNNSTNPVVSRVSADVGRRDVPIVAERIAHVDVQFPMLFWVLAALFAAAFGILYRTNIENLVALWYRDPSWSHGFVVPLIAAFFVNQNWDRLVAMKAKPSVMGAIVMAYAATAQVVFRITGQEHMSNLTMLVMLFGAVLLILGWDYLRVLWLPICYLLFMIAPPSALYVKITTPMQHWAATIGVELVKIFGVTAYQSGTTIFVQTGHEWSQLSVEEACSGIRMLLAFFALAVALAYTTSRPMWQKVFLSLCAAPVAIFCNSLRVGLTGVLFVRVGPEFARGAAHEWLGFAMLIPAMGMQMGIAWLLDKIFVEVPDDEPAEAKP